MQFFRGVVLREVVCRQRSLKFCFENGVSGNVFGDNVGESSVEGFRADTPRSRGMVTKKFDIVFSRIIVDFGFDSERGELGRRGGSEGPGENLKIEFRNVEVIVLASIYFREFVQYFVPVFTIRVLGGVRGGGQGVDVGSPYPIRLLYIYGIGIGGAVIHIPDDIC